MARRVYIGFMVFVMGFTIGFLIGNLAYEAVSVVKEWDSAGGIRQHIGIDVHY